MTEQELIFISLIDKRLDFYFDNNYIVIVVDNKNIVKKAKT